MSSRIFLLLSLLALVIFCTDDAVVACPNQPQFVDCFTCKITHGYYKQIYCACLKKQFKLLGNCIKPLYPCNQVLTNLMYNETEKPQGFNIWDHRISPFLQWKFEEAVQTQTLPYPLPDYMNQLDFLAMPEQYREGWGQVFFLYTSLQNEIRQLESDAQDALIVASIWLYDKIQNFTSEQQWKELHLFVNEKLHQHWNFSDFQYIIMERTRHLTPCHVCSPLYGFLLIKSELRCYKCPPGCTNCTNNTSTCLGCLQGYFLENNQCHKCSVGHCLQCTSDGICQKCESDLMLHDNICYHPQKYCSSNCLSCESNNPQHCTSCELIEYSSAPNDTSKKCFKCDQDQCLKCKPDNTTFCIECIIGFHGGAGSGCSRCMDNCLKCQNISICTQCRIGFSLHANVCQACEVAGCRSCIDDPKECSECITDLFVLDPVNKSCHLFSGASLSYHLQQPKLNCSRGCLLCYNNNTDQCHTCDTKYFLLEQSRACGKCSPACLECFNQTYCLDCENGYRLHLNQCERCLGDHCQCKADGLCFRCFDGYEFNNGVCALILEPYGCMHFDTENPNICKICEPGFAKTQNDRCVQCQAHCVLSCNPHNVSECIQSRYQMVRPYFINSVKEDSTCFYFNGSCIFPKPGYEIREINGTFISHPICFDPCLECDKQFKCLKCKPGYILSESSCQPDISCNPQCEHCFPGSRREPSTHKCLLCSVPHCNSCFNDTCVECNQGFYLQKIDGLKCKTCLQPCRICVNELICQICSVGFFLLPNMQCQPCSEECLTCEKVRTKCLSCKAGSQLLGNRCIGVHYVEFYYRIKGNPKEFKNEIKTEAFMIELSRLLNLPKSDIFLLNTTESPLSISGMISTPESSSQSIFTHMEQLKLENFEVLCQSLDHFHETSRIGHFSNLNSTCDKNEDGGNGGLSPGAIVGIVIGCLIGALVLIIGLIKGIKKLRSRNAWSSEHSGSQQLAPGTDSYYHQYVDIN